MCAGPPPPSRPVPSRPGACARWVKGALAPGGGGCSADTSQPGEARACRRLCTEQVPLASSLPLKRCRSGLVTRGAGEGCCRGGARVRATRPVSRQRGRCCRGRVSGTHGHRARELWLVRCGCSAAGLASGLCQAPNKHFSQVTGWVGDLINLKKEKKGIFFFFFFP